MTPLGQKMRELREARGVTLKQMATALNVSSAYLSALEHGRRGRRRSARWDNRAPEFEQAAPGTVPARYP